MVNKALSINAFARVGAVENRLPKGYFTAVPTEGLTEMQIAFRQSWLLEAERLLDWVEAHLSIDLASVRGAQSKLDARRKWSPAAYSPIAKLRMSVEQRDVTGMMDALARIKGMTYEVAYDTKQRVESLSSESWEWEFVAHMRQYEPRGKRGETTLVLPILGMDIAPFCADIDRSLELLGSVEPLILDEYRELVTRIKLFQGRVLRGETNPRVYGAVFFRLPPPQYHQAAYWIEHLVHEISHLRLELLRVHDPLVLNDLAPKYAAPFRRDPRSMLGVFHATFVTARMIRVVRKLAQSAVDPIYAARRSSLAEKLEIGLKSIRDHGQLSTLGRQIFESFEPAAHD